MSDNPQTETAPAPFTTTLAFILVGTVGVGVFLCMPVIGPALVDGFGFNARQVGEFSFVQLAFVSLGCLLGLFCTKRFTMRAVAGVSLGVLLAMDLLSPHFDTYYLFLMARAVAGIAGGVAMALATGALARLPGAEKNFGLFLLVQIICSVIGIWAIPQLVGSYGTAGVFYPLAFMELIVILVAVSRIAAVPFADGPSSDEGNTRTAWVLSGIMLVAILAFFTAIGSYWTFVGIIGGNSGLSVEAVGRGLSLAAAGGALGSLVPVFLQQRVGQVIPLFVAALLLILSLYLTSVQSTLTAFTLSASLFTFGWYTFHPYQLGVLAGIDRDGRAAMASAALTGFGLSLGPAIVSRLLDKEPSAAHDLGMVYMVSAVGFLGALLLITGVLMSSGRLTAGPPTETDAEAV